MIKGQELLATLSVKYHGNWEKIYKAILSREKLDNSEIATAVDSIKKVCNFSTILDEDELMPKEIRMVMTKPTFVYYYKGNKDLLNRDIKRVHLTQSKHPTEKCKKIAVKTVKTLCDEGVVTVIKLGDGIAEDIIATTEGKNTIVVVPNGFEGEETRFKGLMKMVEDNGGLLLTENPPYVGPDSESKYRQERCDRIIENISDLIVVTEATEENIGAAANTVVQMAIVSGKPMLVFPSTKSRDKNNELQRLLGGVQTEDGERVIEGLKENEPYVCE